MWARFTPMRIFRENVGAGFPSVARAWKDSTETGSGQQKYDGSAKNPISALRCISKSLRRTLSTPHAAEICAP
jgi:hypothetical protein